ncbi:pentapeptide repeat-containing protein [Streptomyces sp. NPDC006530]|uniref:pentapeptide repeat-containing protein n=1 Tax=Streptomyces sp. NPDC006530 TaxID=3364750 RepID=UPI003699E2CA
MPQPLAPPPSWPHCAHGATLEDPVGCRGIHVPGHTACLAHLDATDRATYLSGLTPGDDIDHRGTTFTELLLAALLDALRDPATNQPQLGDARFDSATFTGDARFDLATFTGDAWFGMASFTNTAQFGSATFTGDAWFDLATFTNTAQFGSATFTGDAWFESATFTGNAMFGSATFTGDARFVSATFTGDAMFRSATFTNTALFGSATFTSIAWFGSATFTGNAWFVSAIFTDYAQFGSATFTGDARFVSATFTGNAQFESATFTGNARFESATFTNTAQFESATFTGNARFESATFTGDALFSSATFTGNALFSSATFRRDGDFERASFGRRADFERAVFERASSFGPLVCAGRVQLSGAEFGGPVALAVAAHRVECRRTRWSSTAELRLRYATVDFSHAVFEHPLTIAAEASLFTLLNGQPMAEDMFSAAPDAGVRVASLRGVDAAHLVLADTDLSGCLFTGTVHVDLIRLEGACSFGTVPPRPWWRPRFTERRMLAEEQHWRASQPGAVPGWNVAVFGVGRVGPAQLAPVYRALRKSFEDSKNEPGAADFYYGEMEMRRHDPKGTTRTERGLLHGYWALSGYGLRASRALYWLAATMLATVVLLMGSGIAQDTPKQEATGTVPAGGGKVTFDIEKTDPQNPRGDRFTGERFEKAFNVTLNSVVFRSSGQDLTTAGTYIEMGSRLTEPILLGLAVLAIRNRVKR